MIFQCHHILILYISCKVHTHTVPKTYSGYFLLHLRAFAHAVPLPETLPSYLSGGVAFLACFLRGKPGLPCGQLWLLCFSPSQHLHLWVEIVVLILFFSRLQTLWGQNSISCFHSFLRASCRIGSQNICWMNKGIKAGYLLPPFFFHLRDPGCNNGQNYWDSRNLSGSDGWCGWHLALPANAWVLRTDVCGESNYALVFEMSHVDDGHTARWDWVNLLRINYRWETSLQSS